MSNVVIPSTEKYVGVPIPAPEMDPNSVAFYAESAHDGRFVVLVSREDWEWVKNYTWYLSSKRTPYGWNFYVERRDPMVHNRANNLLLARAVMGCKMHDGAWVGYRNGNHLDCRRENLFFKRLPKELRNG